MYILCNACPYLGYCKHITTECHYMFALCSVPALDMVADYYIKCPDLDIVSTE